MKRILFFCVSFLVLSFLYPAAVPAAPFYEGKTITIVVGYGPGGGYDRLARLFAKHAAKFIPGKPNFIVTNMPGAGSLIAANYLYNLAKPDGLTIGTIDRGLPVAQLLKVEGVKFDIMKYAWLGSATTEATVLTMRSDLPYRSYEDLLKAKSPLILGTTGPSESAAQFTILLKEFLGLNIKIVNYPSSSDIMLAVERKELDGRAMSYNSLKPYIERGLVRPLLRSSVAEAGIENLPADEDLTTDKKGKTIIAMRSAGDQVGRPYLAPPKTPKERVNILREAFVKFSKDPVVREEARKVMMTVNYMPADECLKILDKLLHQPPDMVKEFSKYIKF